MNNNVNRIVPWSNLGVNVSQARTVEDVLDIANLNWKVNPMPIYDANGNEIPGYVANVRDTDNDVLGIVSPKYEIVQNIDAFNFINNLVSAGMTFEMAGTGRNGKQIWILGKLANDKNILGDNVSPYICFTNTHDGSSSVKVCMTPVRVICSNVLNFAFKQADRIWSARHSSSIQVRLEEAKNALFNVDNYMTVLENEADRLANIAITDAALEDVFRRINNIDLNNSSARKIRNYNESFVDFFNCYNASDITQFKGSVWGALMAATDFADHRTPGRITTGYTARNWDNIITGHNFVDAVFKEVA